MGCLGNRSYKEQYHSGNLFMHSTDYLMNTHHILETVVVICNDKCIDAQNRKKKKNPCFDGAWIPVRKKLIVNSREISKILVG